MPAFGIGPSGSTTASGIALPAYRNPLADQLGLYDGGLSVASLASGPDANRYIIVDGLRDDEAQRDQWSGGYLYAQTSPTSGTQLKILSTGMHGRYGALAVANPPTVAIPAGTPIILSWPLPIKRYAGIKGIDDLVNEALARTRVLARISFVGDATQSHSLIDYLFIATDDDVRTMYDSTIYGPAYPLTPSPYGFHVDTNGATRTLVTDYTYPAGFTFEIEVSVRGDLLVYDGSGWLYPTTPGLLDDTYQAAAPEPWVTAFGMGKGIQQLQKMVRADRSVPGAERSERLAELQQQFQHWSGVAHRVSVNDMPPPAVRGRQNAPMPGMYATSVSPWSG